MKQLVAVTWSLIESSLFLITAGTEIEQSLDVLRKGKKSVLDYILHQHLLQDNICLREQTT
jgi:hypothetical protein